MEKRLIYLDVLRIIACMMVIMMHAPISGDEAESHGAFLVFDSYLTAPCVPLFFMVSGALLLPCKNDASAFEFLKKRIGKIIGPTVLFSLFYVALNSGLDESFLSSVLSIPFCAQGHGVLWFMYTLAGLYLLVPILSPWLHKAGKRELQLYLGLWSVTLLYPYLRPWIGINTSDTGILYYFTGYAGYFLLGYYLHRYSILLKFMLPLALAMLPLPLLTKVLEWNLDFYSAFWYLSAPVAIMTAVWFCVIKKLFEKHTVSESLFEPLAHISNLCFGIYLIHIFVMRTLLWNWTLIQGIDNYYIQTMMVFTLTFLGSCSICWGISHLPFAQYIIGYKKR